MVPARSPKKWTIPVFSFSGTGAGIPHLKTATSPAAGWFDQQPYHKAGFTVNRLVRGRAPVRQVADFPEPWIIRADLRSTP